MNVEQILGNGLIRVSPSDAEQDVCVLKKRQ